MTEDYRRDYSRGWRSTNLDAGDARREPSAWYDGYFDAAAGRNKWHLATCEDRDRHETCGA